MAWPTCNAFPEGIPSEILNNEFDHREPHEGDRDIQFEPDEGRGFLLSAWVERFSEGDYDE